MIRYIILCVLLFFYRATRAQFIEFAVIPGSMLLVAAKHPDSYVGIYGGSFINHAVIVDHIWFIRPELRFGVIGVTASLLHSGLVLGGGVRVDTYGPYPTFSPDLNIRLHPFMLLFRRELRFDLSVLADVTQFRQINLGIGIVLPIKRNCKP
jgi:hypothetical protein